MIVQPRLTGEQIRELRESRGLNQTEFGKIFGVGRRSVAAWEANTWRAPADLLAKFTESAVDNSKAQATERKVAHETLEVYSKMRKDFSHAYIVKMWFERGFTPSAEAQELILAHWPDITRKEN